MHSSKIRMTSMWLVCIALLVASAVSASSLTGASASQQTDGSVSLATWPGDDGYVDFGQAPQWMFDIEWVACKASPDGGPCTSSCYFNTCESAADCCASCLTPDLMFAACRNGICIYSC